MGKTIVLLAGFKQNKPEDLAAKRYYEQQGKKVRTYNKIDGLAEFTDIYDAASGVEEVVCLANRNSDNDDFYRLCARVAGNEGAILSRRPRI